jgi:hypothetical protein
MSTPIKAICAWCKAVLREGSEPATHGICPACASAWAAEGRAAKAATR